MTLRPPPRRMLSCSITVMLLLLPCLLRGQVEETPTGPEPPDTSTGLRAAGDTSGVGGSSLPMAHNPKRALRWSLIPGGGQVYNRAWLRALFFVGAEAYYLSAYRVNSEHYANYDDSLDLPRGRYLDKRNKYAWWVVLVYIAGMLEAYVDAHLAPFPPDSLTNARSGMVHSTASTTTMELP